MTKILRKHQKAAFRYALRVPHPALFLHMRLGKTLVAIRRCKLLRPRIAEIGLRVLIVAPSSALDGWREQCEEERFAVHWLTGTKKKRREVLEQTQAGFHLINKEGWQALPEIAKHSWDAVIADESTFLKNPSAKVTKFFLRNFRDVPLRMALTGTPDPEGPENFFCQFAFLYGRAFGCSNYWEFRNRFMEPHPFGWGWRMKPGAADSVRRQVGKKACIMRREDVGLKEQRVYERRTYQLPTKYRKAYDEMETKFASTYLRKEVKTKWNGARYAVLRQMSGGWFDDDLVWTGKLDDLTALLLGELRNDSVVVWCNFNCEVAGITERLLAKRVACVGLTGATPNRERNQNRLQFHQGKLRVLVLQQAIAQTGMDLSKADTAIYFSSPVSGFARQQTEDRILSIEKIQAGTPMLFIDLVCEGTVDEDVLSLIDQKETQSDASHKRALQRAMKERLQWTSDL